MNTEQGGSQLEGAPVVGAQSDPGVVLYPKVTIIVSTWNRPELLDRALASIHAQFETFRDFEVVVVDDASTISPEPVLRRWAFEFMQLGISFRAIRLGENSGYQAVPKNVGIEMARGDYIRFLDDDNEFTPGSLRVLVDAIEDGESWPQLVYGRREYVLDTGCSETTADGFKLAVGPSPLTEHDPKRLLSGPHMNYIDTSDFLTSRGWFWYLFSMTGRMWNDQWRRFGDWELLARATFRAYSLKWQAVDAIVTRYHWVGTGPTGNLQLTRRFQETPVEKSMGAWYSPDPIGAAGA